MQFWSELPNKFMSHEAHLDAATARELRWFLGTAAVVGLLLVLAVLVCWFA